MIIVGIDPGLDGAVASIDTDSMGAIVYDMPTFTKKEGRSVKRKVDGRALARTLQLMTPDRVFVEKVGAMPNQGVTSMFNFGFSAGIVNGAVSALEIDPTYLTPQAWQKLAKAGGSKDRSRERAMKLFPNIAGLFDRKKDNGRSDAVLIAYAGVIQLGLL